METKDYDAARLVIENLTMLRQAFELAENIFKEIYQSIAKQLDSFIGKNNQFVTIEKDAWDSVYEFSTNSWACSGAIDGKFIASYQFNYSVATRDGNWFPQIVSDSTEGQTCFWLCLDPQYFNGKRREISKMVSEINEKHPKLKELGFNFDSKEIAWFLPWQLDPKKLSESYPNSLEDAFEPLEEALKKLKEAHGTFEEIIEEVKVAFPLKENDD